VTVATQAPAGFRLRAGIFGLAGVIILVGVWAANEMDHWRAVVVVVAVTALTVLGVVRLLDLGSSGVVIDASVRETSPIDFPRQPDRSVPSHREP